MVAFSLRESERLMHSPPAYCPEHGLFPVAGFRFPIGATGNTFIGCTTRCPRCHGVCEIIPGVYDALPGGLNILIDSSISVDALKALRSLAERVQREEIGLQEARAEAVKISPLAAQLFDFENWSEAKAIVVAAIIGAITAVYLQRGETQQSVIVNAPLTVNFQPVIERVIDRDMERLNHTTAPVSVPIPERRQAKSGKKR
jgi:hypothetical protein